MILNKYRPSYFRLLQKNKRALTEPLKALQKNINVSPKSHLYHFYTVFKSKT